MASHRKPLTRIRAQTPRSPGTSPISPRDCAGHAAAVTKSSPNCATGSTTPPKTTSPSDYHPTRLTGPREVVQVRVVHRWVQAAA